MKSIAKFLALGVFAASTTLAAHAIPFTYGVITISGQTGSITTTPTALSPNVSSSTTSITFTYPTPYELALGPGSGSLGTVPMEYTEFVTTSTFTVGTGTPTSPTQVFGFADSTAGGQILFFYANDVISLSNTPPGTLQFQGYVEEENLSTGLLSNTVTAADFNLTPGLAQDGSFVGTLTVAPTPEPSSLLLLGTGLASAAGMVFRKRRSVIA